jgi:hypothetical protein
MRPAQASLLHALLPTALTQVAELQDEDHRHVCSAAAGCRHLPFGLLCWRPELHKEEDFLSPLLCLAQAYIGDSATQAFCHHSDCIADSSSTVSKQGQEYDHSPVCSFCLDGFVENVCSDALARDGQRSLQSIVGMPCGVAIVAGHHAVFGVSPGDLS